MNDSGNDDKIVGEDQTNGLAGNLEGDDDGALDPEDQHHSLFEDVIDNGLRIDGDSENPEDDATTKYSEEQG
jgi:hypothetical protein